jgi:RNA polymerase sigma-70 factor (sigma-E family)
MAEALGGGGMTQTSPMAQASAWDADEAVTWLFAAHYRPLVRLATLLLHDAGMAEEIVQDAYVALHGRWGRLRDSYKALAYLRATVVNRCRSALRHRVVVERHLANAALPPDMPSAEAGALGVLQHDAVIAALRALPARQREAIVLRYYVDLAEGDIAEAMGCSRGAVKSHTSRGMAALRITLERQR